MAYIKIFGIKSTVKKAVDYITNPDKTDEQNLVSSYGCSPETADLEFAMTAKLGKDNVMEKGDSLAWHIIISFKPGEITDPHIAHEVATKIADATLKGKHEYVLSTHGRSFPLPHDFYCQLPRNKPGQSFSYSARLSCSRVYPISGNTQSVSAITGSLSHIVYGLQDSHSSWPASFGSIIINSPLCQESHCRSNVSMQTSVSVHPRTDCPWTYLESYLAGLRRTGKLI